MSAKMSREREAVDRIMRAARRHVVAFARSRKVSTANWDKDGRDALVRAERNLRTTATRIVRTLIQRVAQDLHKRDA